MIPVRIVAASAHSGLGIGEEAIRIPRVGERGVSSIRPDRELEQSGLRKPWMSRAAGMAEIEGTNDRAERLLESVAGQLARELGERMPGWQSRRIGLVVGTSSGGMLSLVEALERRNRGQFIGPALAKAAPYFGPLPALERALGVEVKERVQVLAACASAGYAIGLACRWLELGRADLVIAGGYDAVSVFVAAGFEAIGATTGSTMRPFRADRDGMALGEGAALLALAPGASPQDLGYVRGFGASADAVHLAAPDETGAGLAAAALSAMKDAGIEPREIDLVSVHGTATRYNDAAEARALQRALGPHAGRVVVHAYKADIGHTLGASTALEGLAALAAMRANVLPAASPTDPPDPALGVQLLETSRSGKAVLCLKLSAAFGGANAALVLSTDRGEGRARTQYPVYVRAVGGYADALDVDGALPVVGVDAKRLSRLDPFSGLCVAAVAKAIKRTGERPDEQTGIVVASATSSLESNERFHQRLRERGAACAEPRRFLPTSPNLASGQCAIAFGWHGPTFTVGGGLAAPLEGLLVGYDLVSCGEAETIVVVAAEHVGPVIRDIWGAAGWPVPAHGAVAAVLSRKPAHIRLQRDSVTKLRDRADRGLGILEKVRPGWAVLLAAMSAAA